MHHPHDKLSQIEEGVFSMRDAPRFRLPMLTPTDSFARLGAQAPWGEHKGFSERLRLPVQEAGTASLLDASSPTDQKGKEVTGEAHPQPLLDPQPSSSCGHQSAWLSSQVAPGVQMAGATMTTCCLLISGLP